MKYNPSAWAAGRYPSFHSDLKEIAKAARWVDPFIPWKNVLVCVRKCRDGVTEWSGCAWPSTESVVTYGPMRGWNSHAGGRIDLRLSEWMEREDNIRLIGHELRHLGQFHRRRLQTGTFGIEYTHRTRELDAETFEEVLLETMGER